MPSKHASPGLRAFFAEELQSDSNATLETALWHLRDFFDRGPEGPEQADISNKLAETEELIASYGEHTPLADFT